jgi:hypothetical protein
MTRVEGQIDQVTGRTLFRPATASVAAHEETAARTIGPVHPRAHSSQHVEIDLPEQGDRPEGPARVARSDQTEIRRQVLIIARMARAQEPVGPDYREPHHVLATAPDRACLSVPASRPKEAIMGGHEDSAIGRIYAEPVDVIATRRSEAVFPSTLPVAPDAQESYCDGDSCGDERRC